MIDLVDTGMSKVAVVQFAETAFKPIQESSEFDVSRGSRESSAVLVNIWLRKRDLAAVYIYKDIPVD
ncbi:hypothetical protein [Sorangium sp. So ce861]|uniref:hypothetical protein n=1 Tax=Sorangium sp. So ce861 TaxID=3133323 RepID=UPI003F6050E9